MPDENPLDNTDKSRLEVVKLAEEITKIRLENQKLEKDLVTYDERFVIDQKKVSLDRSRFVWETVRLLGVAIITGGLTLFGNYIVKKYELGEDKVKTEYSQFLSDRKVVLEMQGDLLSQTKKACAVLADFTSLKTPEAEEKKTNLVVLCNLKDRFVDHQESESKINNKVEARAKPSASIQNRIDSLENVKQNLLDKAIAHKEPPPPQIKVIDDSVKSIANKAGIGDIAAASDNLSKNYVNDTRTAGQVSLEVVQSATGRKMADDYPRTSWFKKGYFLVFDNMKITLVDFDPANDGIIANVCEGTDALACPDPFKKDMQLNKNSELKFTRNNADYIIRLDHIGRAGNNPFTKAAYVTFEKYVK